MPRRKVAGTAQASERRAARKRTASPRSRFIRLRLRPKPRHPIPILVPGDRTSFPLLPSPCHPMPAPQPRAAQQPERAESHLRNQDFSAWACLPIFENTERNRSAAGDNTILSPVGRCNVAILERWCPRPLLKGI